MVRIAPFFIVCSLLVTASGQAEGDPTDSAFGNFTGIFIESVVRNFVDEVIEQTRSIASRSLSSLFVETDARMLRNDGDYPLCDACEKVHTLSIANISMRHIREECSRTFPRKLLNEFCTYVKMDIAPVSRFLYGYVFDRSRSFELATAVCIEYGRCPPKAFFSKFDHVTVHARFFDVTAFFYCPYRPNATFSECSQGLVTSMIRVSVKRADDICYASYSKGVFEEFCYYYVLDKDFGRGQLASFLDIFDYAVAHCAGRECSQRGVR